MSAKVPFVATALILAAGGVALGDADRADRLAELEARVAELESRLQEPVSAQTAAAVLADAQRRTALLADGSASAGWDNGFFIRSGSFVLRPSAFFQFRLVTDYRESAGGGDSQTDSNFEVRRMKFGLEGTIFDNFEYLFVWNTNPEGGSAFIEDAMVKYNVNRNVGVRVGQFKDPISKEWLTHDGRALAIERSMVDAFLGGGNVGRTQGAMLILGNYADNPLYIEVGVHDGANQLNTDFQKHAWDFGVAGRVEYKLAGDWAAYRDFSARGNKDRLLVVGAGGDWSQNGDGDQFLGVADVQFETAHGCTSFLALHVRRLTEDFTGGDDQTDWGAMAQAGYAINGNWEVFARWSFVDFDDDVPAAGDEDFFHELTVGFNYYMGANGAYGHRAKVTVDLSWYPDGVPAPRAGLDLVGNSAGEDELLLKGQFQLWI